MFYIIQENLFKERHYDLILHNLERMGLEYEIVKILPFTNVINFETKRQDVFCFGSVKLAHIANLYKWQPGSFYNDNHDYEIYSKYYKEHLLNYDSIVISIKDNFDFPDDLFFIRPTKDSKLFTGKVFSMGDWKNQLDLITANYPDRLNDKIQVCYMKDIYREIRCWIVNGKCVTASQYKIGDRVVYENTNEPEIIDFVNKMSEIYQPASAYVMDVCITDDGLKIVEINCINAAGFYDADLQKLIYFLEENFN